MLVFEARGKPENPESSRVDSQKNQPANDIVSGNETPAALLEVEFSHRCANLIPLPNPKNGTIFRKSMGENNINDVKMIL